MMKTVFTGLSFLIPLLLVNPASLRADDWTPDPGNLWFILLAFFIVGFGTGYFYHFFMGRLKRPEDYWANRFLREGDRKSAVKLVELRPDSLDLMSSVYRSGFDEAVDGAYRALLHLGARDIFWHCFSLDVETERSARALLEMKYGDAVCMEKIFQHPRIPVDLVEKAAQRLVDLGCTQLLTMLLTKQKEAAQSRQIEAAIRILMLQPGGVGEAHKKSSRPPVFKQKIADNPVERPKMEPRSLGATTLNLLFNDDSLPSRA